VDPCAVRLACERATALLLEVAGGTAATPEWAEPAPGVAEALMAPGAPIPLRSARVEQLLGIAIEPSKVGAILSGFGLVKAGDGWIAPSFRADLTREVDLIEELIRVIGIDTVPPREQARFVEGSRTDRAYDRMNLVRATAVGLGLFEARSITLTHEKALTLAGFSADGALRVRNPMIEEQVILRPTLLAGLLQALEVNVRAGAECVRLFELGRVFSALGREEGMRMAFLVSGASRERSWKQSAGAAVQLPEARHLLDVLLTRLGVPYRLTAVSREGFVLALNIEVGGKEIGFLGHLHPAQARSLGTDDPVLVAELDFDLASAGAGGTVRRYTPIPRFPGTSRDIALLAPLALQHAEIEALLLGAGEPLLVSVTLFDIFTDPTGQRVAADQRSLAYTLVYRAPDRTLTAEEANSAHGKLKELLVSKLGVTLRE
jgi:phenylalanyl-tRNA synthetase beta chain